MKHIIVYILLLLTATSCGLSEDGIETIDEGKEVELSFALDVPEAVDENIGLKAYDQNSIRSIDLLVFDQANKFLERIKVNNISGTGSVKTFSVRLRATSQSRIFHIVANGRDQNGADIVNLSSIAVGALESNAIPSLKTNTLAANRAPELPLIMWGRAASPNISATTNLGTIKMLRTTAAMYIECAVGTATNGLNDFSLTGFTVLKSSNMGKVAPNAYTSPAATPTTVSLIAGSAYIDYVASSGTGIWANAANGRKSSELYLYERTNVLNNTGLSVIIRGKYKGVDGYYKVWLNNNLGQVVHIVRNHRYQIRIAKVLGAGYTTLKEAIDATHSANIFINIIDNNNDITDIIVDGKYELGVSSNSVAINGNGAKTIATILNTNTTASLIGTSNVGWISNITFAGSGTRRTLTATLAPTSTTRSGIVSIRAGSLVRTVTVTQNP